MARDNRDEADARAAARILARLQKGEEPTLPFDVVKRMRTENRIKVLREHRRMTQQASADAVGMNRLYLSQIETGRATGGLKMLTRIATALNAPLDVLIPGNEPAKSRRVQKWCERSGRHDGLFHCAGAGCGIPPVHPARSSPLKLHQTAASRRIWASPAGRVDTMMA